MIFVPGVITHSHDTTFITKPGVTKIVHDSITHTITLHTTDDRTKIVNTVTIIHPWYDIACRWIAGILFLLFLGWLIGKYLKFV